VSLLETEEAAKMGIPKKRSATLCRNLVQRCATVYGGWLLAVGGLLKANG